MLTKTEVKILELLLQGESFNEMENTLSISKQKIKNHVDSLCNKLNAKNTVQAVFNYQKHTYHI